jgi:heterodisulfide reductase subunit B
MQLDNMQSIALRKGLIKRTIPVVYLTQLLGLAMGMSAEEMLFEYHRVKVNL